MTYRIPEVRIRCPWWHRQSCPLWWPGLLLRSRLELPKLRFRRCQRPPPKSLSEFSSCLPFIEWRPRFADCLDHRESCPDKLQKPAGSNASLKKTNVFGTPATRWKWLKWVSERGPKGWGPSLRFVKRG